MKKMFNIELKDYTRFDEIEAETEEEAMQIAMNRWKERQPRISVKPKLLNEYSGRITVSVDMHFTSLLAENEEEAIETALNNLDTDYVSIIPGTWELLSSKIENVYEEIPYNDDDYWNSVVVDLYS